MEKCPRCTKSNFNTITICRYEHKVPVNKCKTCGFLWISDKDLIELAEFDVKRLFLQELIYFGKTRANKRSSKKPNR